MGVRARVADWPPKRDPPKDPPGGANARDAVFCRNVPAGHQPPAGIPGFKALHRLARRRSKDVEFPDGWSRGAGGLAPLRHRSSSEVTLSECDPEEAPDPR
ncbi:SI1L3 protein, partial [Hemiprocne comata]|nr:SI1L3 protein [Hemiprocne comata]